MDSESGNGKSRWRSRKSRNQKTLISFGEIDYFNSSSSYSNSSDESYLSSFGGSEDDFQEALSFCSGRKSIQSYESDRSRKRNSLNEKKSRRKRAKQQHQKSDSNAEFGKISVLLAENHTISKKQAEYLSCSCLGLLKNLRKVSSFSKIVSCLHQGKMSNVYIVTLKESELENDPKYAVLKIFHKDLKWKTEIEDIKKANFPCKYTSKKDAEFWAENESRMIKILAKNPRNYLKCAKVLTRFHNSLLLSLLCPTENSENHQSNQDSLPRLINACKNSEFANENEDTLKKLVYEAISYLVFELSLFTPTLSAYSLLLDNTPSLYLVDLSRARMIKGGVAEKLKISSEMESKILMQICH